MARPLELPENLAAPWNRSDTPRLDTYGANASCASCIVQTLSEDLDTYTGDFLRVNGEALPVSRRTLPRLRRCWASRPNLLGRHFHGDGCVHARRPTGAPVRRKRLVIDVRKFCNS